MRYQGIKVNVITGFLGAGKTTLIHHLLEQAPVYERWAVLVNEFGDIGLDGVLLQNSLQQGRLFKDNIAIKEVPGGCVCCTTSAAFEQGLNQLIRQQNPDRILIEPSGLGHPKQILEKLRATQYQDVLLVTGSFCVIDARHLSDPRYVEHEVFNDQVDSANGIVFSHVDTYSDQDAQRLKEYCRGKEQDGYFLSNPMSLSVEELDIGLNTFLSTDSLSLAKRDVHHSHSHENTCRTPAKEDHYVKEQDAMMVAGWRWSDTVLFSESSLRSMLSDITNLDGVYRVKGVCKLNDELGLFVNASTGEPRMELSPWTKKSRLEVIGLANSDWYSLASKMCKKLI
ncbi:CobW family GTP-binding protein [Marinomonas algicola]|uniref:CobW family GTP-binding protein n=1 Tax=Marinomonas algicola TaxID=2773454 RepID=UPI00174E69D5|nr:GTP-binding protein [Marinomonas algicola]